MNISKKVHLLKPHISVLHVTHMVHFACRQVKSPQGLGDNVERGLKLEYDIWVVVRIVHQTRRPTQPGQPDRVRPVATLSDDSGGRTRVPTKLTRPHAGQLSVFGFQTRDNRPEPNPLPFR